MPTYSYRCEACEHELDEFQWVGEKKLKKCPACGKPKLERLCNWQGPLVDNAVTTLGKQGEVNLKKLSQDEKDALDYRAKFPKKAMKERMDSQNGNVG